MFDCTSMLFCFDKFGQRKAIADLKYPPLPSRNPFPLYLDWHIWTKKSDRCFKISLPFPLAIPPSIWIDKFGQRKASLFLQCLLHPFPFFLALPSPTVSDNFYETCRVWPRAWCTRFDTCLVIHWSNQCCQVPVFVRIFTEIRPVIRSTEIQWSIPQIWKNQNQFRKVSISNKFQFQIDYAACVGDRLVNQLAADQHLATRYYLNFDTTLVAWHALSVVRVQFGGLCLVFNDHVWATKFPTAQEEEGEKSWSISCRGVYCREFRLQKKKKARILPSALVAPWTSPLTMAASTT